MERKDAVKADGLLSKREYISGAVRNHELHPAAERLCLTQPAVTHHIHYLEQHYGCQLFSCERKVLRLTEAGLRLREFTRSMSYNSQKIEEAIISSPFLIP